MTELNNEGEMVKKMDAKKFYAVYYQMTELIPLFSYLERLNALKFTLTGFEESLTQGIKTPTVSRQSIRVTMSKGAKLLEEVKDSEKIKIEYITKDQMETPKQDSVGECSICLDNLSDIMLPCLHAFCSECIVHWQAQQQNCPICRSEILIRCQGMTAFSGSGTDEIYCIINSSDSVEELADEINMRVSAATRSLIDCKKYRKVSKAF